MSNEQATDSVPFDPYLEDEDAQEEFRQHYEHVRPLQRARAQNTLNDLATKLEENEPEGQGSDLEQACDVLDRIAVCLADDPVPAISSDFLDFEEWFEYDELRYQYGISGNMVMLIRVLVLLVQNGVAPGRWILEPLAEAFDEVLDDRDPALVARKLGLQAKGSGLTAPRPIRV
jgi:hypothetical protein